jgi:hypothetical protein
MQRHSSYNAPTSHGLNFGPGMPIRCQDCAAHGFRRSRLQSDDMLHLLLMRYPVRCLRCSERQLVSFTVAGLAVPSYVQQRRARRTLAEQKHRSAPHDDEPNPASTPNAGDTRLT